MNLSQWNEKKKNDNNKKEKQGHPFPRKENQKTLKKGKRRGKN